MYSVAVSFGFISIRCFRKYVLHARIYFLVKHGDLGGEHCDVRIVALNGLVKAPQRPGKARIERLEFPILAPSDPHATLTLGNMLRRDLCGEPCAQMVG